MANKKKISFIIQARTGSTRLLNKMTLPFYKNKTLLDIIIEKLKNNFEANQIILATSLNTSDIILEATAKKHKVLFFKGDENNVLKRFIDCATTNKRKHIIRICADNPFLDIDLLLNLIENINLGNIDYASYSVKKTPAIKTHFGFFAEFVSLEALLKIQNNTTDMIYLEHVTNYIYSNPKNFKIKWIEVPVLISKNTDIRLTVDTKIDFENCQQVYKDLAQYSHLNYKTVINYLNLNPDLKNQMFNQIKLNEK